MASATSWWSARRRGRAWVPRLRWRIALAVAAISLLVILVQAMVLLSALDEREEAFINDILNRQVLHSIEVARSRPEAGHPNTPRMQLYRLPANRAEERPPPMLASLGLGNHEVHVDGNEYHVAVRDGDGVRYFLSYDVAEHEARMDALTSITLAGALAIAMVTLTAVYFLAGHLTRNLNQLARDVGSPQPPLHFAQDHMEEEVHAVAIALDQATARQRAALAREREFAGNLSHELRTPLTAIRTDAELIAVTSGLPPRALERAEAIVLNVDRITNLASSLLLLARELQPQQAEAINLRSAVLAVWALLADSDGCRLECEIPPGTTVFGDPALLDVLLRNLLVNAVAHGTPASGQPPAVICSFADGWLAVRDFGPGIAEADLPQIFHRFQRGSRSQGHGVGLALVKRICEACGWQVSASNAPGGGSCFRVRFAGAGETLTGARDG